MKTLDIKKIVIIFSVLLVIVATAIILAVTTGNVKVPALSDPNGVFYQRTDENGNVIYTLTNQELFEQMKANDGINQLLLLSDKTLLADYINKVTDAQVADKIKQLTYGTSDPDSIAKLSDEQKKTDEDQFAQAMVLAGYQNNEADYAKILIARELYTEQAIKDNGDVTASDVAKAFINSYFNDISAIKISFTSIADATAVMHKFNLVYTSSNVLGTYNGYVFKNNTLMDNKGKIVEAYQTVDVYYYDTDGNILNSTGDIVYTKQSDGTYTDSNNSEFRIDANGNLINSDDTTVVDNANLFNNADAAKAYKDANTTYYKVSRTDPFDMTETINVTDSSDNVVFTINPTTNKIYDASNNDVTDTTTLYVNKQYKSIGDVDTFSNNSVTVLSGQEILNYYIKMYNYVYGEYRDTLPEGSTAEDLIALNDSNLQYNYDDLSSTNPKLATYMFQTLSALNNAYYSVQPQDITDSQENFYLVYKLSSPAKLDIATKAANYLRSQLVLPTQVGGDLTLPNLTDSSSDSGATYLNATVTWTSSNTDIIDNSGKFTAPDTNTSVTMTYTLTIFGETKTGTFTVTALANGDTVPATPHAWPGYTVKDLIGDDTTYNAIYDKLVHDMVYGSNGKTNVQNYLIQMRKNLGFTINDQYLAWDYQGTDKNYVFSSKGDKSIIAYYTKTLNSDQPLNITADQLFNFAMNKNPALYTVYAGQYKEFLYSTYFKTVFGDQLNIDRNKSLRMKDMVNAVQNTKGYYSYLKNLYSQYGMTFSYDSYKEYAYKQYGTKTDLALLQHYIIGELQPFLIQKVFTDYDIMSQLYTTVQDYYTNYFSLNVTHVLIYLDRNEDGTPDNYNDYIASLSDTDKANFESEIAALDTYLQSYTGSLSDLVSAYNNATRDDATWGQFKQLGFKILTENLNKKDSQDSSKTHSLTYSGTYGIKDSFAQPFVDALVNLYQEYQLPQNTGSSKLDSDLVPTQFGLHRIEVTKGDDFTKPTCQFTETDPNNPVYADGSENPNGMPTIAQVQLYAEYYFYSKTYDLTNTEVEKQYGITVPSIPASVKSALDVYLGVILDKLYVIGTVNVGMADNLTTGDFMPDPAYTSLTKANILSLLSDVHDVYYHAMFDQYNIPLK